MNDRELLELAAKAAGIKGVNFDRARRDWGWNPLADDGDALRLAVKLGLTVDVLPWGTDARPWNKGKNDVATEPKGDDPYAATRRAIVRAAAEIERAI